jgi:hypothetical protein
VQQLWGFAAGWDEGPEIEGKFRFFCQLFVFIKSNNERGAGGSRARRVFAPTTDWRQLKLSIRQTPPHPRAHTQAQARARQARRALCRLENLVASLERLILRFGDI